MTSLDRDPHPMEQHVKLSDLLTMEHDALMDFWARYNRPSRKDAAALIGDRRPGYTSIASGLATYACNLAVAKSCWAGGHEQAARIYETHAALSFDRLPEDIRARIAEVAT